MTSAAAFRLGYQVGHKFGELTAAEIDARYGHLLTATSEPAFVQGMLDGDAGDQWRLARQA